MAERIGTAADVANLLGHASAASSRRWIARHKPRVVGRTGPRDTKLYDLDECADIAASLPGQGARTDLHTTTTEGA